MAGAMTKSIEVDENIKRILVPTWLGQAQCVVAARQDNRSVVTVQVEPRITLVLTRMASKKMRDSVLVALARLRAAPSVDQIKVTIWLPRHRLDGANKIAVVPLES